MTPPVPTSSASSTSPRRHENRGTILDVVAPHGGGLLHAGDGRRRRPRRRGRPRADAGRRRQGGDQLGRRVRPARFVARAAEKFGAQAIVVAIDAKQTRRLAVDGEDRWEIFTHGGRKPTGIDAVDYREDVARLGAGEILLTSMDRDGTRDGFDLALTRTIADARSRCRVVASGGVGNLDHLVEGVRERPGQRRARRLDLPFRHLHAAAGQGAYGARPAFPSASTAEERPLCPISPLPTSSPIVSRRAPPPPAIRNSYTAKLVAGAGPHRQEVRRGGGGDGDRRRRGRPRGIDRPRRPTCSIT